MGREFCESSRKICLIATASLILLQCRFEVVQSLRFAPNEITEPSHETMNLNFRTITADKNLYALKRANLLDSDAIPEVYCEDKQDPNSGEYLRASFKFNSSEFIRRTTYLKWFIPIEERTGLHYYDKPEEMEAAAGPQVDQELCGLHLDLMIDLLKKHHDNIATTTDINLFHIMNSYGIPKVGLASGNTIFEGDYKACTDNTLLVSRKELAEASSKEIADDYFVRKEALSRQEWSSFVSILWDFMSPFLGFKRPQLKLEIAKYRGEAHELQMRYCYSGLRWPQWPNSTFDRKNFVLRVATCLPESCDSRSLQEHKDKIKLLVDRQMSTFYSGYYLDQLYCLPDEKSPLRNPFNDKSFIAFLCFNLIWTLLTLVSTIKSKLAKKPTSKETAKENMKELGAEISSSLVGPNESKLDDYLKSWSLSRNLWKFLSPARRQTWNSNNLHGRISSGNNSVSMDSFEGMRFAAASMVITAHSIMIYFGSMVWNNVDVDEIMSSPLLAPLNLICPSVVDMFFVMTGVLTMLFIMGTSRKSLLTFSFWLQFILYRYIRIVPMYLLSHWFMKSSQRFLGSGPFWDYGTSNTSWSHLCQTESWWHYILPNANFRSPTYSCNPPGWYLANDLQFALITPIIILLYTCKPLLGHLTIISASLASFCMHLKYYYSITFDPRASLEWSISSLTIALESGAIGYVHPKYRCVAYLIGLFAGYFLHRYKEGHIKKWPNAFVKYGKLYVYFIIYIHITLPSLTASLLPLDNKKLIKWVAAIVYASMHSTSSIAYAILMLLITTGHFKTLSRLLNDKVFKLLSNTALTLLLIHMPIQYYESGSLLNLYRSSGKHFIEMALLWVIKSYILASIIYIVYEIPMRRLLFKLMIDIFKHFEKKSPTPGSRIKSD